MLPLEPGCLAIVTYGNSKGKTVTAVKHVGNPSKFLARGNTGENDCWEVDPPVSWMFSIMMREEIHLSYCPAKFLMRIDGYEETNEDTQEDAFDILKRNVYEGVVRDIAKITEEDQETTSNTVQLSTTTQ